MAMSPDPEIRHNVRVTVTATAVIINLVVILILDEIYGAVAVWLTELGTDTHTDVILLYSSKVTLVSSTRENGGGGKLDPLVNTAKNLDWFSFLPRVK